MNRVEISIIVASYQNAGLLKQCMDSLLDQTIRHERYEIIVVDDCSGDDSIPILKAYEKEYPNLSLLGKERNEGLLFSRIDGMKRASGDYIAFVDSDDWVSEDMCRIILKGFASCDADIIEFGHICEDGKEGIEKYQVLPGEHKPEEIIGLFTERKINTFVWLRAYRQSLVKKALKYMETAVPKEIYRNTNTDDEFLFPILLNCASRYASAEESYYHYRMNREGSITDRIERNPGQKLGHAMVLIRAGKIVLNQVEGDQERYRKYLLMQTNNLFYMLGNLPQAGDFTEQRRNEVRTVIKDFFRTESRWSKWRKTDWSAMARVATRILHLGFRIFSLVIQRRI